MIIQCPECELPVSDKAISCQHCGYPLRPGQAARPSRKSNKRRRLPNGTEEKSGMLLSYDKYKIRFKKIVVQLGLNPDHRAHDGRKHFVTMAKKYGVNDFAIKYIVGHTITDITEKVYTERDPQWLHDEIEKIK